MKINKIFLILIFVLNIALKPAYSQNNSAVYYYNLGVNYQNKGQNELAVQNYKKALSLDSKFSDARYNLGIAYYNLAIGYSEKEKYDLSIQNYRKLIELEPKNFVAHYNLGVIYNETGQNDLAIQSYKKALILNPKSDDARYNLFIVYYNSGINYFNKGEYDRSIASYKEAVNYDLANADVYNALANSYLSKKEYDLAIQNYQKALGLSPQNLQAQHNLQVAFAHKNEKALSDKINTVTAFQKAPSDLYGLIRLEYGSNYGTNNKVFEILDLIWSDPEGQKLLNSIRNNRIPITITLGSENTSANIKTSQYSYNINPFGIMPILLFKVGQEKEIVVNIGEEHIRAFKNPYLSTHERIYAFQVVVHELCHAVKNCLSKSQSNSLEEEISASMIGYNIAFKLIEGREMSREEAYDYSQRCLQALLTDDHRYLQVYNDFNEVIQNFGIYPPHLSVYQNVVELYRSIRNDPRTQKLNTLESRL